MKLIWCDKLALIWFAFLLLVIFFAGNADLFGFLGMVFGEGGASVFLHAVLPPWLFLRLVHFLFATHQAHRVR